MTTINIGTKADGTPSLFLLNKGNRHGLVTGATGTGKTVTLQRLAEGFSRAGVPVFAADVKGDLSGIGAASERGPGCPVKLFDVFREHGAPIRTSVDRIGPLLMARMLNCNQVQEGTLNIAFRVAADDKSPLFDLDDLRWTLHEMHENRASICERYGNVTASSIAAIQREVLALEAQGAVKLFGEPPFKVGDLMEVDSSHRGVVSLLHADNLMEVPRLYAGLLLWLLTELFRQLPEAGDLDRPKLVLFFDEAHLLFSDAPTKLLETIERVVRLVRSKGVGVFFVTQNPADVPDSVLAQLGNRVQHALRAYTAREQRMVRAAAQAFRLKDGSITEKNRVHDAITNMGLGEALVSFLDDSGVPSVVERVKVSLPESQVGPLTDIERKALMDRAPVEPSPEDEGSAFIARWRRENGITVEARPYEPYDREGMHERLGGLSGKRAPVSGLRFIRYAAGIALFGVVLMMFGY